MYTKLETKPLRPPPKFQLKSPQQLQTVEATTAEQDVDPSAPTPEPPQPKIFSQLDVGKLHIMIIIGMDCIEKPSSRKT